jgi:hypothetical protein
MVQTIRVDQVLRETVATPYRDLVTRTTGAAVRTSIERAILAEDSGSAGLPAGRYLVLSGVREDHSEAIDHVLRHHDLAILVADDESGPCRILGFLAADLAEALTEVLRRGPLDVATLSEAIAWPLERAALALDRLTLLRLVQAEGLTYRPVPIA